MLKKSILAICTIIAIFSFIGFVYADSNIGNGIITKQYIVEDLDKDKFYKSLESKINENGKNYILKGVKEEENQETLEKDVEISKSKIVKTPVIKEIVEQIQKEFDYTEDGFQGKVSLDEKFIQVKKNNVYTKEYKVYYEKNYYNLKTNDLKDIPKTIKINGVTYYLVSPIWHIAETQNINGKDIPTKYNAVMKYEGIKKEDVTVDYIATFKYKGKLAKQTVKSITYKVEYLEQVEETKENNIMPIVATSSVGSIIFVCVIIFKMKNVNIYNYKEGRYKLIKRAFIKNANDQIDLVNGKITTNKYKIKLSNHLYNKINGQSIYFKYYDKTYKYKVRSKEFEITV